MSITDINNIDALFPIAGIDQPSQGFRNNFSNIKNALLDLDSSVVQVLNDLNDVDTASIPPSLNNILKFDGTKWIPATFSSFGGLANVVEDTTPQLGGDLDVNGNFLSNGSDRILELISTGVTSSWIKLSNSAFATPIIYADGFGTDVNLSVKTKGSGIFIVDSDSTTITGLAGPNDKTFFIKANKSTTVLGYDLRVRGGNNENEGGNAGHVVVKGGDSAGSAVNGNGGNVVIQGGNPRGTGTEGGVNILTYDDRNIAVFRSSTPTANVNWYEFQNGAQTLSPKIIARGVDTNVDVLVVAKGASGTFSYQTNSDTFKFPVIDGTSGQAMVTDGNGNLSFATISGGSGITDVVQDLTPQLGGNLDVNGNSIVSVSNGNITLAPNGTGRVVLDGVQWPATDGTTGQVLTTNGLGSASWTTISSGGLGNVVEDLTPQLGGDLDVQGFDIITSTVNGNIEIIPNGTGRVVLDGVQWPATDGTTGQVLTTNGLGVTNWTTILGGGAGAGSFRGTYLTKTSTQSVPNSVDTIITWDNEIEDTDTFHDNVTNNSRITIPSGITRVRLDTNIRCQSSINAKRIEIIKNGTDVLASSAERSASPGHEVGINAHTPWLTVIPGDYFEVRVFQDTGAALNILNGGDTWFALEVYAGGGILGEFTIASKPSATSNQNSMIVLTDDGANGSLAYSNGTNWIRIAFRDNNIIP